MSLQNRKPLVRVDTTPAVRRDPRRLFSAATGSIIFHGLLFGVLLLLLRDTQAGLLLPEDAASHELDAMPADDVEKKATFATDIPADDVEKKATFATDIFDPTGLMPDVNPGAPIERKDTVTIPNELDPRERVGLTTGDNTRPPTDMPPPPGFGRPGEGGTILEGPGGGQIHGMPGGEFGGKRFEPGGLDGRSGTAKKWALVHGGGTPETEAAVTAGLKWIVRNQMPDGRWLLDDPRYPDRGGANDIAGTAFGLLPLLGAGIPKLADKSVERGLSFLIKKQDKRTGNFGGGMYAHGLATIALCEAYSLTRDSRLRRPAQMAVRFIALAQHDGGGWRYAPGQAGDTSVTGWQVMALKSAQMAGLDVPDLAMRKAQKYLDSCCSSDEGYGYVGRGSKMEMSAVGLLCRQYLQSWGPQNLRMIKGVDNHLRRNAPDPRNMYYTYYAAQVLHHFGGQAWKEWNQQMQVSLLKAQDQSSGPLGGSWSSAGDPHGPAGGRLMQTSLSILTLEVYYRYLPLYFRDADMKKMAAQK